MSESKAGRDRVLIVEDEAIVAMEISDRLSAMGYDVIGPASTGKAAIELALSEQPDLVLMDVRLKGSMDGPEAATRIREQLDVPFVFLTAYADDATLGRVRPIEPHAYIVKPLEERSLAITIHMALHRHRAAMERTKAELAQRRSEARYRAVLDNSHDGIVCVDDTRRITVFNKGAERIFGYSAEEMLGQPLDALVPDDARDRHAEHVDKFQGSGATARLMGGSLEVKGRRSTGEVFPAEVTISRTEVEGERLLTACIRDVSDRQALEEQFTRAQKMEAVGRLAASVAHDFNNLLAAVQSNVYLLKSEAPEGLKEYVGEIGAAVERGVALTRQLLSFSRPQPSSRQSLDANDLVSGAESLLRRLVREDVVLRTQLTPSGRLLVDRHLMEQVLMNLVVNARDAMPHGGELTIRTSVETVRAGDTGRTYSLPVGTYVRLAVSDTGTGIPIELEEKVFEPFFTTKPPGLGTGLGLSTVRAIVRRSGGDVRIEHSEGPGTTLVVLLPQVDARPKSIRPRSISDATPGGTETILMVEDDIAILRGVSQILERSGYRVLTARTCDEALAVAGSVNERIDLLLSDLIMPGCSGRELARRITSRRKGLPVLFMTGYSDAPPIQTPLAGHERVLQKPVAPHLLLGAVRECLDEAAVVSKVASSGEVG
jgi:two-component system, cell cycle sensor histidine kinase and response regulator CckA